MKQPTPAEKKERLRIRRLSTRQSARELRLMLGRQTHDQTGGSPRNSSNAWRHEIKSPPKPRLSSKRRWTLDAGSLAVYQETVGMGNRLGVYFRGHFLRPT